MKATLTPTNIHVVIKNCIIKDWNGEYPVSLQTQSMHSMYTLTQWHVPIEINRMVKYHIRKDNVLALLIQAGKKILFTIACNNTDGANLTCDNVIWSAE